MFGLVSACVSDCAQTLSDLAQAALADDVMTMGGNLAELASYILDQGGKVANVLVLVNDQRPFKAKVPI